MTHAGVGVALSRRRVLWTAPPPPALLSSVSLLGSSVVTLTSVGMSTLVNPWIHPSVSRDCPWPDLDKLLTKGFTIQNFPEGTWGRVLKQYIPAGKKTPLGLKYILYTLYYILCVEA